MNRNLLNAVRAVAPVSLVLCLAVSEGALAQASRMDEEAIRKLLAAWTQASNNHDAKAGTAFFTSDADYVNVFGSWSKGATAIEKFRKDRYETVLKDSRIAPIDIKIRFIRPDVALVHELHDFSGMLGPNGEKMPTQRELGIRVLVKQHGKWLVAAFHNTVVRPAAASAGEKREQGRYE